MTPPPLRILHISDLHQREPDLDRWRRERVLGPGWRKNVAHILDDGPIDFVCLTGDIAYAGKTPEYAKATDFIEETLQLVGLSSDSLLIVPGNHDVDWAVYPDQYEVVRRWVRTGCDEQRISRYLAGAVSDPPAGLLPEWLDLVLERQRPYERWLRDLGLTALNPSQSQHGRLGYAVRRVRRGGGAVEFIGLNTAWLSGSRDNRDLLLTEDQLGRLVGDRREPGTIRVVLMHHSFTDLIDGRTAQYRLAGRADIVLRGHLHRTESAHFLLDQGRGFAEFAVGSLFDSEALDRYPNGCQVVTIHAGEAAMTGSNWFRSWSDSGEGFWHNDNSLYARTVEGRLAWVLRANGAGAVPLHAEGPALAPHPYADYLRAMRRSASREGVSAGLMRPDRVYVPQRAQRVPEPSAPDGGDGDAPAETLLLNAMAAVWSGDVRRVLVFGNYGMGKTYFALRTVIEHIDTFVDPLPRRLPIYYPLRRLDCEAALSKDPFEHRDVIRQILDDLRNLDFPRLTPAEFEELLRQGSAVLVLDGLDELKTRTANWEVLLAPVLAIPEASCVITSRTAYVEDKEPLLSTWHVYELEEWRAEIEWRDYAMRCADAIGDVVAFLSRVDARPRLRMLTTRPLWCFMIVTVANRVIAASDVNEADLYHYFLKDALDRVMRQGRQDRILSSRHRFVALEAFARKCADDKVHSLSRDLFRDLLNRFLADLQLSEVDNFLDRELRVYSFLNVDGHGDYSFGHASFESYFVAASVARDLLPRIADMAPSRVTDLRDTWIARIELDAEQRIFLAGILRSEEACDTLGLLPSAEAHQEAMERLDDFVRFWLANPGSPGVLRRNLFLALVLVRRYTSRRRPKLADLSLRGTPLSGADISGCDLDGVDFTTARLERADFSHTSLRQCRFTGTIIDGANFTGAELVGTDLGRIQRPVAAPIFDKLVAHALERMEGA